LGQKGVTGIQGLLESAPKPFSTLNTPPLLVWLRRFVGHSVERIRAASSSLIEERFLGKGEVDSSILSGSTMHIKWLAKWLFRLAHEMPMKYPTLLPVSNTPRSCARRPRIRLSTFQAIRFPPRKEVVLTFDDLARHCSSTAALHSR
jgi:hypothetical protein